jgi:hypothetical protein
MLSCSVPEHAARILDLNGRTKIKLIGDSPSVRRDCNTALMAKWTEKEIAKFIELKYALTSGEVFDRLVMFGTMAGCPEYVKTLIESGESDGSEMEKKHEGALKWAARWTTGADIILEGA